MNYWTNRESYIDNSFQKTSQRLKERYVKLYEELGDELNKEIEAFMGRYGKGITISSIKLALDVDELEVFRRELKKYYSIIKKIKNNRTITKGVLENYKNKLKKLITRVRISRIDMLKTKLEQHIIETKVEQDNLFYDIVPKEVENIYKYSSYNLDLQLGFSIGLLGFPFAQLFEQKWFDGSFSSRLWKDKNNLMINIEHTFVQSVIMEYSHKKLALALGVDLNRSMGACERLLRTEVLHYFNQVIMESYKQHNVKEYRFITSLEESTCQVCGALDGKIFKLSEAIEGFNYPIIHPNCRCSTSPYYSNSDNIKKTFKDKYGEIYDIPNDMTFEEWKELIKE